MKYLRLAPLLLLLSTFASAEWLTGKLVDTEQQKVKEGSTTTYHSDSDNRNATSTKTDNIDTYQVYTIQGPTKTYIAREKLYFPWSKPANVSVGDDIKFTVQGNRLTILDDDMKPHKASIVKTSLNQPQ
jgi:hypothetical protein